MKVKQSKIHGLGLFADKDYKLDEEIMRFKGNPAQVIYINHSCNPNAYVIQPNEQDMQTHVMHAVNVKKGQEITINYRFGKLYKDLWEKTIKGHCTCGYD